MVLETFVIVVICIVGYALTIAICVKVSEYFLKKEKYKMERQKKEKDTK